MYMNTYTTYLHIYVVICSILYMCIKVSIYIYIYTYISVCMYIYTLACAFSRAVHLKLLASAALRLIRVCRYCFPGYARRQ